MALLLATALLVATALYARVLQGSWAAPGAFFALAWVIGAVPAVVVLPKDVTPWAMLFVTSFIAAALAGAELAGSGSSALGHLGASNRGAVGTSDLPLRVTNLMAIAALLGLCGVGAAVGYVWDAGLSLTELADSSTWIKLAVYYSIARYDQAYTEPVAIRLLVAANYAGAFLGGMVLAMGREFSRRIVVSLPIIAGCLLAIITTAKAPMLETILFSLSGWLTLGVALRGPRPRRHSLKRLLAITTVAVAIAAIGIGSLVLRYGVAGVDLSLIVQRIGGYVFGQMAALSAWLSVTDLSQLEPTWGAMTFSGIAAALHLSSRVPGLYESIALNGWAAQSNVFTALRGTVTDFGMFGAWFATLLAGGIAERCYVRLQRGAAGPASVIVLAGFYSFAAWAPVTSVFTYNVNLLAIAIAGIVLAVRWPEVAARMERAAAIAPSTTLMESRA